MSSDLERFLIENSEEVKNDAVSAEEEGVQGEGEWEGEEGDEAEGEGGGEGGYEGEEGLGGGDGEELQSREEVDLSGRKLIAALEKEFGVSLSQYSDDREALRGLVEAKRLVGRRDEASAILKEVRRKFGDGFIDSLLKFDPSQIEKRKKAEESVPEVEWDDSWLTMIRRNENGELVPAPGAPPDIVAKVQNFAVHRERLMNELAKSPKKFVQSLILDVVNDIVDSKIQAFGKAYADVAGYQSALEKWKADHHDYLYDKDGNLTPLGDRFIEVSDSLIEQHQQAYGTYDPLVCFNQAWEIVRGKVASSGNGYNAAKRAAVHNKAVKTKADYKDPQQIFKELLSKEGVSLAEAFEAASKVRK